MNITKEEYITAYREFEIAGDRTPRKDLIDNTFSGFITCELRPLTSDEFERLIWVYSPDNEVTVRLTQNGNKRLLKDVAETYIKETANEFTWDANETKILPMIKELELQNISLPPIFIREKYETEPRNGSYYIEDGIHRSTALAVYRIKHSIDESICAYIGCFS